MPQYGYSWTFPIAIYQVCQLLFLQLFHLIECFNRTDKWKSESPLAHHQVTPPEVITDTRPNRNVLSLHAGDMFNYMLATCSTASPVPGGYSGIVIVPPGGYQKHVHNLEENPLLASCITPVRAGQVYKCSWENQWTRTYYPKRADFTSQISMKE